MQLFDRSTGRQVQELTDRRDLSLFIRIHRKYQFYTFYLGPHVFRLTAGRVDRSTS